MKFNAVVTDLIESKTNFRIILVVVLLVQFSSLNAQNKIDLTLEKAVDIAMKNSYGIKMLEMRLKSSTMGLKAEQNSLKTQVFMNFVAPNLQNISENRWNSEYERDEIVRLNTSLWQSEVSVKQPLIFFGYPTDGSLSLNYKLYQYSQTNDFGDSQTDFYNRLYLKFEQPFFLPNHMKNKLEEAELSLKDNKLSFDEDKMSILKDISLDYYELFKISFSENIYKERIKQLNRIYRIAQSIFTSDSAYRIDVNQIMLEQNNVNEKLLNIQSSYREKVANIKQKLRLNPEDSILVEPKINLEPLKIDVEKAIGYGLKNNPVLKMLEIDKKRSEIYKEYVKGDNTFHMTLMATYGLEKKQGEFQSLWEKFYNSNSITLNAYLPIWDGGERDYRLKAEDLKINQNELRIVEKEEEVITNIRSNFSSMNDYYNRSVSMQHSIELARKIALEKINQYSKKSVTLNNLLKTIDQVSDTKENFIGVYTQYVKALLNLKSETYYDFRNQLLLIDNFENEGNDQ